MTPHRASTTTQSSTPCAIALQRENHLFDGSDGAVIAAQLSVPLSTGESSTTWTPISGTFSTVWPPAFHGAARSPPAFKLAYQQRCQQHPSAITRRLRNGSNGLRRGLVMA